MQVVSADGQLRGTCYTPESAINPLRLTAVDRKRSRGTPVDMVRGPTRLLHRDRREVENATTNGSTSPGLREARSAIGTDLLGERVQQQKIISCDLPLENLGVPICLHVRLFFVFVAQHPTIF